MRILLVVLIGMVISNGLLAQKWENTYGSWGYEVCHDVVETYDGGYLMASFSPDSEGFWILKTDINGELLWDKKYTWPDKSFSAFAVDQNSLGEILITGWINYTPSKQWPMLIKLDSCGNKQWCRVYIDYDYNGGNFMDAILYENGDALVLTHMPSPDYTDQVFLWYIDTNGNVLWRQVYASKTDHPLVNVMNVKKIHQVNNEYMLTGYCYYPHPDFPKRPTIAPFSFQLTACMKKSGYCHLG